MYFKQLELGPMQNFVYLIGDPKTREAAVVDPGWEAPVILRTLHEDGYRLTKIFVTHHHFDHVTAAGELLTAWDVPVHVHRDDAPQLDLPRSGLTLAESGQHIPVGGLDVTVIHTPGHTAGSQCLLVNGRLLSGDTLFIGSCGRCDLPDSSPEQLYESLSKRLHPLDDHTILCPGHNYGSVPTVGLGEEKHGNPFLSARTKHEFMRLVGAA